MWGNAAVHRCIREDIFNDRYWPDFLALSTPEAPFLRLETLERERPIELDGLRITPVLVDHTVRNFGLVFETPESSVVIVSDTSPTERIWEIANGLENLSAVFLEAAFPNAMRELADVSKHLTPELFGHEARKLRRPARIIAVHIKPRYHRQIVEELEGLGLPNLEIGEAGREYEL